MYETYWKLKEKPFENTPDPKFFYSSPNHEEALMRFYYVVRERKGAGMLTGEYGCGKTVLSRYVIKELVQPDKRYKIALIVNPALSAQDFLKEIIFQLGGREYEGSNKLNMLHTINDMLYKNLKEDKETVIIVDEAQAIDNQNMFEELRLLLNFQLNNRFLLTLILIGQPELREKIANIPQLKQRMAISFHLITLSPEEVEKYINHRTMIAGAVKPLFSKDAIKMVAEHSGGVPRCINTCCELALMQGMLGKKDIVDIGVICEAVEDINT
jgi:general secretion pathway protein A